ncbi:D-ribose pyranase [Anaerosolibacter carboniphilus]|uniref:D-ribose pyranase n=1 Tax=Anaerosolibacter carboniphilus TaxID=1417629 RepID=A0A841KUP1_9FIRM|nr:D-ribose pyranase [Anaerosolibacter carboniphilus]MBB6215918.1 D-ribose pyranase [Anaerosolibacter carboniphilus]
MKKSILINSEISYAIAKMGHKDMLTICDSGLPIPKEVERIDISLRQGIPTFIETLETVLEELRIEEVIIAKETKEVSPLLYERIKEIIEKVENKERINVKITEVDHELFKTITKESACIVRTGEYTPYANIILKSGVVF